MGSGAHGRLFADRDVDALWMQWNKRGWGKGPRAAYRFLDLRRAYRGPLVVTLHDVFDRDTRKERWLDADTWSLRLVARSADRLIVHSEVEVERLAGIAPASKIRVVPHFVEERNLPLSAEAARAHLGVAGRRVVTLLGFIYGRKGHGDLVEALPHLPPDVLMVFAGGAVAGREGLHAPGPAARRGAGRRRIACASRATSRRPRWRPGSRPPTWPSLPFRDLSASGSLSTWIAAGKPILASDLPGFHEYDRLRAGRDPLPGQPRARATRRAHPARSLESDLADPDPRVVELRAHLTVPRHRRSLPGRRARGRPGRLNATRGRSATDRGSVPASSGGRGVGPWAGERPRGQAPRRASTLSVRSQGRSRSSRPKWPYAAVCR